jgi:signal transduction histidine kinase
LLKTKFPIPFPELESWLLRGGRWEGNLVQQTRDGREIVVAFRKVLRENDGSQRTILEIGRDITAQLQAEEALRRAERFAAMGRVAGIIAHEINNPLEAVTNAMYLLRDHPSLDDDARQWSRLAEQELERIAHITKQTLSFYRESQHAAPVAISDVLDSVLELQSRQLQLAGIKLEKDYRCNGVVEGSANEFRQVFLNLIGNAIQAMPSGGTLRVRQSRSTDRHLQAKGILISICDTGTGIRPEDAKRIFEPFFSTKATKGTGLGLWISRGIIQKYDGNIRFRTVRSPRGNVTCFIVFIPEAHVTDRRKSQSYVELNAAS